MLSCAVGGCACAAQQKGLERKEVAANTSYTTASRTFASKVRHNTEGRKHVLRDIKLGGGAHFLRSLHCGVTFVSRQRAGLRNGSSCLRDSVTWNDSRNSSLGRGSHASNSAYWSADANARRSCVETGGAQTEHPTRAINRTD